MLWSPLCLGKRSPWCVDRFLVDCTPLLADEGLAGALNLGSGAPGDPVEAGFTPTGCGSAWRPAHCGHHRDRAADARESALFTIDARTPMVLLNSMSYDQDSVPIEQGRRSIAGDRMAFAITIKDR